MRRRLLDRLPPVLQPILELRQIADTAEQPEFDALWQALETLLSNQFVETADESGIARFERVLGITPRAAAALSDRRFAGAAQVMERRPTTLRFLERQLEALCGADGYTLSLDPAARTLAVRLALSKKEQYRAVEKLIAQIKPANIASELDLLYNRHSQFFGRTFGEMAAQTHHALRSEVQ